MIRHSPGSTTGTRLRTRDHPLLPVAISIVFIVLFMLITPFILEAFAGITGAKWDQLGNIGQAFGGMASVLGIVALAGIIASLSLQRRESMVSQALAQRTVHGNLMTRALDDPILRACWGPFRPGGSDDKQRQFIYTNMIVSFWSSMFDTGMLTEEALHTFAATMFSGEPGRDYWSIAGSQARALQETERGAVMIRILDEEYARALTTLHMSSEP
jgi:hypothetical protein